MARKDANDSNDVVSAPGKRPSSLRPDEQKQPRSVPGGLPVVVSPPARKIKLWPFKRSLVGFGSKDDTSHKRLPGTVKIIAIVVIVMGLGIGGYVLYSHYHQSPSEKAKHEADLANQAYLQGDKDKAIAYAKKVLADDPDDIQNIIWLASMVKEENPAAAKQYYAQALEKFKQFNHPDTPGKPAATYWSAASLAQQAGEKAQAEYYYHEVIVAANDPKSNQQYLAERAQSALKDLQ